MSWAIEILRVNAAQSPGLKQEQPVWRLQPGLEGLSLTTTTSFAMQGTCPARVQSLQALDW